MVLKNPKSGKQFDAKLAAYTLAGAAVLAAPTVRANAIVYVPNVDAVVTQPGSYNFNLSGVASDDITISATTGPAGPAMGDYANEVALTTSLGAEVQMDPLDSTLVADLAFGTIIDPTLAANWGAGGKMIGYDVMDPQFSQGDWSASGGSGYLGFYFQSSGLPYAGWANISTTANANTSSFEVLSYAYQTTANTAIAAGDTGQATLPEPSTMALIALGGAGLIALRRRRAGNA